MVAEGEAMLCIVDLVRVRVRVRVRVSRVRVRVSGRASEVGGVAGLAC